MVPGSGGISIFLEGGGQARETGGGGAESLEMHVKHAKFVILC